MGILAWQKIAFRLDMWPLTPTFAVHPVHLIVLGLALIPPTLWEIFVMEQRRD